MRKRKPTPEDVLAWMEEYAAGREIAASRLLLDVSKPTGLALSVSGETQMLREWIAHCRTRLKEGER